MENVDKTIDALCIWIQDELKGLNGVRESTMLPETIKALA